MNNASLNKIVTVTTPVLSSDVYGGQTKGADSEVTKYADVRNVSGHERLLFGGDNTDEMVVFIMRYYSIDKAATITWDNTIFKIEKISTSKDKRFMKVYVRS